LPAFEVSCRDDGQQSDRVLNDNIQTCQGEVTADQGLSFALRVGGGEMTATVAAAGDQSQVAVRYFEWNESGLHQIEEPAHIVQPIESFPAAQPQVQVQSQPNSLPVLPFILGAVAGLGLATVLSRASKSGGLTPVASVVGRPPDIEQLSGGLSVLDATIEELMNIGPLVIAHPESVNIGAVDSANIVSVTERDVTDLIDALKRLATVYPCQRLAVVVVGELESVGDPGVSYIERLVEEAPLGSVIRVLK
jgi:hypothetical protein